MHFAYLIVIVLAAAANIYAGLCDFTRPKWLLDNMKKLEVEERWLPTLGILKLSAGLDCSPASQSRRSELPPPPDSFSILLPP